MSEPVPEGQRTHIYLPQLTPAGNLALFTEVTVLLDGQPYLGPLSLDIGDTIPISNPATFQPGVINIWADEPMRVSLRVSTPDSSYILSGVDFWPHPDEQVVAQGTPEIKDDAQPEPWKLLRYDIDGGTFAVFDPYASRAHHDGSDEGSTVVSPGSTWEDESPYQTWVGYRSGNAGTPMTGAVAVGSEADPYGEGSVAVGYSARAQQTAGGTFADRAVVMGWYFQGGQDSVALGHEYNGAFADPEFGSANLAPRSVLLINVDPLYYGDDSPEVVAVGYTARVVVGNPENASGLGSANNIIFGAVKALTETVTPSAEQQAAPRVVLGSTANAAMDWRFGYGPTERMEHFALMGNEAVARGPLEAKDSTVLGGAGKTVGFFGVPGVAKATITDNNASPSVTALLNALASLGLLTRA